jgi:hypothetical protein
VVGVEGGVVGSEYQSCQSSEWKILMDWERKKDRAVSEWVSVVSK